MPDKGSDKSKKGEPLMWNQTIINIDITVEVVVIASVTIFAGYFAIKWTLEGNVWRVLAGISEFANRKWAEASLKGVIKLVLNDLSFLRGSKPREKIEFHFTNDLAPRDLDEGEAVPIVLNSNKKTPKNVATTAVQYIGTEILSRGHALMDRDLHLGMTLCLARNVLKTNKLKAPQRFLEDKIIPRYCLKNKMFEQLVDGIRVCDDMGLLTRLMLQQYYEVSGGELPSLEYSKIQNEFRDFYEFVKRIAKRSEHDNTNLKFNGEYIKTRVLLVTSSFRAKDGAQGLVMRIDRQVNYENVFLICPAINCDMVDRKHLPAWDIYSRTLKLIKNGKSRYSKVKSSSFYVKGKHEKIKVGITLLQRSS